MQKPNRDWLTLNLKGFGDSQEDNMWFAMVAIDDLNVDKSYQREENAVAEVIGANFNPRAYGVARVALRDDGKLYLIDAQQRTKGAKIAGKTLVPCIIHYFASREEEAKLFRFLNEFRVQVTVMDCFRASLVAKEPHAVAIDKAVREAGFKVGLTSKLKKWPYVTAIDQLTRIYNQGGEVAVLEVLQYMGALFPEQPEALRREALRGMFEFWNAFGVTLEEERLRANLKSVSMQDILHTAEGNRVKARQSGHNIPLYKMIFAEIRSKYKKRVPAPEIAWPTETSE